MATTVKEVLDLLRKQGVEIKAETEATVKNQFDGQVLAPSDKVLKDGEMAERIEFVDAKTRDVLTFKEKARKAEKERDELASILEGEGDAKTKIEKIVAENKRLKSLADAHLSEKKQLWKDMAENIPEPMKKFFKFAEADKELTDEETLQNVSKLREYTDIGAIKVDGGAPAPDVSRSAPGGGKDRIDTKAWEKLPPAEKIKFGYREEAKKGK
jgi:hypothetical protein